MFKFQTRHLQRYNSAETFTDLTELLVQSCEQQSAPHLCDDQQNWGHAYGDLIIQIEVCMQLWMRTALLASLRRAAADRGKRLNIGSFFNPVRELQTKLAEPSESVQGETQCSSNVLSYNTSSQTQALLKLLLHYTWEHSAYEVDCSLLTNQILLAECKTSSSHTYSVFDIYDQKHDDNDICINMKVIINVDVIAFIFRFVDVITSVSSSYLQYCMS